MKLRIGVKIDRNRNYCSWFFNKFRFQHYFEIIGRPRHGERLMTEYNDTSATWRLLDLVRRCGRLRAEKAYSTTKFHMGCSASSCQKSNFTINSPVLRISIEITTPICNHNWGVICFKKNWCHQWCSRNRKKSVKCSKFLSKDDHTRLVNVKPSRIYRSCDNQVWMTRKFSSFCSGPT